MCEVRLAGLRDWFLTYVRSYYNEDPDIQLHMKQKEDHTLRVTAYCRQLAEHLGFSPRDAMLAELIGLFHDVGRFQQYTLYRTFDDRLSINHAQLGLQEIAGLEQLAAVLGDDREVFETAILYHNAIRLPDGLTKRQELFCKLIRDADKLDIYYVLAPYLEPPTPAGYSSCFIEDLLSGKQSDFANLKTPDDRKLVRLNWIYDVNFSWTLQRIKERGYVEDILSYLPQNSDIAAVREKLQAYIQDKTKHI